MWNNVLIYVYDYGDTVLYSSLDSIFAFPDFAGTICSSKKGTYGICQQIGMVLAALRFVSLRGKELFTQKITMRRKKKF